MKRIVKWLIPCLVACFMGLGLVQNQGFIFAEDQMEDLQTTTFDSPETYSITGPETVKVGGSITLTGSYGNNHNWKFESDDEAEVEIQNNGNKATITGVVAGNVMITHTYYSYILRREKTETIPITVVANDTSESQPLYIYTLIPGADPSLNLKDPNSRWNGMGVGSVTGLNNVTSYNVNTIIYGNNDIYQNIANGNIILPEEMPDITYPDGGRTYQYWGDDLSEVGTMPQIGDDLGNGETCSTYYYTIEWFRLTCGDGANAGHNNKITAVSTGTNTFHLDGTLKRNDILHVDFKLMNYDSDEFEPVNPEIYSWDIESGKTFNYSAVPTRTGYVATELDVDKNGTIDYVFDGWYTDEEMSGTKNTFKEERKYTVTSNVTFYGRYVPASVAEPDKNYITVTKTFDGITKEQIPDNFSIQVGSKSLEKSGATISDNGLIWTWKLNVDGGTYDISESNADVTNYTRTVTVNGVAKNDDDFGPVTVEESNIILTEGDYYESCNNTQFRIGVNNNTNTVFFGATKTQVVVISTNSFSEGQKAAIIKWLNNQNLSGNWSLNNVVFYSKAEKGNSFKLLAGTVSFDGNIVTFGNKKMWTHAMTATYDVTKALNPDVDILNKYEIKTVNLIIQKEVTGLGADKTKDFGFEYSYGNENGNFTLTNGQTETIKNVPVGTTLTIQETNAQGYETTAQYGNAENLSNEDVTDDEEEIKTISILVSEGNDLIVVTNHRDAAPITGIIDNTPKGLGLIGSIVVEIAAIAFVLKKKRQLKM